MTDLPKIRKLNEEVINRIAAGEIIVRPANALKELLENCLDAKATIIQVTVKHGGLKLLQIQDNGCGIRKEDFEIVCERFTTSKLREYDDLQRIATFGFRGEALASISHIAHLSITSKTKNEACAYQASFIDGILQGKPKPTAGNQGTIITVEDLFYNMRVRRTALKSAAEEYQRISEVVMKYAVHNAAVGFALKKWGENNDVRTPVDSNHIDNIKLLFGNIIASELIQFKARNKQHKFVCNGLVTNANYSTKKFVFLLFINHRLVDCQNLKKAIDEIYSTYLPRNSHPFVYMSLELDPSTLDVNIHPTKHEVHFLNEDQIVEVIARELETTLLSTKSSRTFYTQAKLPGFNIETNGNLQEIDKRLNNSSKAIEPKDVVRADSSSQKLDKFLDRKAKRNGHKREIIDTSLTEEEYNQAHEKFLAKTDALENMLSNKIVQEVEVMDTFNEECFDIIEPVPIIYNNEIEEKIMRVKRKGKSKKWLPIKIKKTPTNLHSILELREAVEENCHRILRETFAQHVFVGSIDPTQALVQYGTKLYLCNTQKILSELFYQFTLYNFQSFDYVTFENGLPIVELVMLALNLPDAGWTEEDGDKRELAERVCDILKEKAELLDDYFSLKVDADGLLKTLPILLENYFPDLAALPMYMLRLASDVNWDDEKECFHDFAVETGKFYANVPEFCKESSKDWKHITEYLLYPAIKQYFIPQKSFAENAAILEIANLTNLYKVFERC